eukprot:4778289-Pleurochrysis_carterae.AAC.1
MRRPRARRRAYERACACACRGGRMCVSAFVSRFEPQGASACDSTWTFTCRCAAPLCVYRMHSAEVEW